MAFDQSFGKSLNDFVHGSAAPTITTLRKVRLFTSANSSTATGTEVTAGGGYATGGVAITFGAATTATPSVASNNAVSITNMPAATGIGYLDITDTTATAVRLEYGSLSSAKTTASGDTLSFAAGAITSSLS